VNTVGATHRTLRQAVADEIHALITSGELKPGERLVEDRLAAELGVSRNPVREAIRLLEATGLVEVRPRRGAYVITVDTNDLIEVLQIRSVVEGWAAAEAAKHRTPEDIEAIRRWIREGRQATKEGNVVRSAECHRLFHVEIERLARNRRLAEVTEPLRNRTELVFSLLLEQRGNVTWSEHEQICTAIEAGDPDRARQAVGDHLAHVQAALARREESEVATTSAAGH
jgi:DNA-binding GntR family transcriptional regulator